MYDETFIQNTKDYIKQFVFDGEILPKELAVSIFENYNTSKIQPVFHQITWLQTAYIQFVSSD